MLKTVLLINIFVETVENSTENSKYLFEIEIFCHIIKSMLSLLNQFNVFC